jgi:hypothetical protein
VVGSGAGERDGGERIDEFDAELARQHRARGCGRRSGSGLGAGQLNQGAPPGGDTSTGEHREAERERLGACVDGGMPQLFIARVEPGTGNSALAGVRGDARISSPARQIGREQG